MKWQDKLTVDELRHVRAWGGVTLEGFKENRIWQLKHKERMVAQGYYDTEPCWQCRKIAEKLGLD